tara:strand:- start:5481 stop:5909 length:429 start_codon:yes stop_codon:yes gene_type:complete
MASKNQSIFQQLEIRSKKVLTHYVEDFYEHDKNILQTKVKPGEIWLWQVRPAGTWLIRWDEDIHASKNSLLEAIIRSAINGNYAKARWYLLYVESICDGQPIGTVSRSISPKWLSERLPRPKTVKLPQIKAQHKTINVAANV